MSENKNNNSEYKETFLFVPTYIADLPGMSIGRLKFYSAVFQFWHKNLDCFLSNDVLALRSGLKKTQINDAFLYFEQHQQMIRIQKGNRRYILQPQRSIEMISTNIIQGTGLPVVGYRSTGSEGTGLPVLTLPSTPTESKVESESNIKNLNKEIKKNNNAHESFECFFSLYPIKKAKQRALTAWITQGCNEIAKDILFKLQEQTEKDSSFLEGYAPNPDRYIFEERWKDEIHIRTKSKNNKKSHFDHESTSWADDIDKDVF